MQQLTQEEVAAMIKQMFQKRKQQRTQALVQELVQQLWLTSSSKQMFAQLTQEPLRALALTQSQRHGGTKGQARCSAKDG